MQAACTENSLCIECGSAPFALRNAQAALNNALSQSTQAADALHAARSDLNSTIRSEC